MVREVKSVQFLRYTAAVLALGYLLDGLHGALVALIAAEIVGLVGRAILEVIATRLK